MDKSPRLRSTDHVSGHVRNTATLLEVLVATKMPRSPD